MSVWENVHACDLTHSWKLHNKHIMYIHTYSAVGQLAISENSMKMGDVYIPFVLR